MMGWSITTNNVDKWEIVSSVVDDVIASFESEHDLKIWIAREKIYEGKLKAIELMMSFPHGWNVNNIRVFNRGKDEYSNWLDEMYESEDGYKVIDEKLNELMNK